MADLKVEFGLLESAEQTMTSLTSEFKNIKAQASDYDGAMGSGDIAGAMGSFSGNWDYHRDTWPRWPSRSPSRWRGCTSWLRAGPTAR